MSRLSPATVCAIALGFTLGATPLVGVLAQPKPAAAPKSAAPAKAAPAKPAGALKMAPPSIAAANPEEVEPEALQALQRMGAHLATLTNFEVKSDATLDLVTEAGQRVQLGGVTQYKVRRPNGFQIDLVTDYMHRKFYYDGKQFTVYAPELSYYATAPAPPTIPQALDVLYNKFGISLPLEDLFRWNDPSSGRADKLTSGFVVGPAVVDGVQTDHYAFREGSKDWEIWIQQGPDPMPRKLVIVDRQDPARPAYEARLTWNEAPKLAAEDFTFTVTPDVKQIHLATLGQ